MGDEIPERRLTRALQRSNSDRIKNAPESSSSQVGLTSKSSFLLCNSVIFFFLFFKRDWALNWPTRG